MCIVVVFPNVQWPCCVCPLKKKNKEVTIHPILIKSCYPVQYGHESKFLPTLFVNWFTKSVDFKYMVDLIRFYSNSYAFINILTTALKNKEPIIGKEKLLFVMVLQLEYTAIKSVAKCGCIANKNPVRKADKQTFNMVLVCTVQFKT